MIVTFISRCNGSAINKTREILDAFAIRIGDFSWQTAITEDGLNSVFLSLKKNACKNTAVACHKIKGNKITELLWVVGSKYKFNTNGSCPVNYTKKGFNVDYLKQNTKNLYANSQGQTLSEHLFAVGYLSTLMLKKLGITNQNTIQCSFLAGALHDIGKIDKEFQNFINKNKLNSETPVDTPEDGTHIDNKKFSFDKHPRHNEISLILSESYLSNKKMESQDDSIFHAILYHHMKVVRKEEFDKYKVYDLFEKSSGNIDEIYSLGRDVLSDVTKICEIYKENKNIDGNIYNRLLNTNDIFIKPSKRKGSSDFDSYKNYHRCKDDLDEMKRLVKVNAHNNVIRSVLVSSDRKISRESAIDLSERIKENEFGDLL